jgi:ribosomal-protein-alanine N-acetyltransferase
MNISGNLKRLDFSDPDFQKIIDLDQDEFPRPWSNQDWHSLAWSHHFLFAWFVGSDPVGFILIGYVAGDDASHLLKICLKSNLRGTGSSHLMWENLLNILRPAGIKSIFLEVEADNSRAISYYKKLQFIQVRVVRSFYSDGKDGIMMLLTL